MKTTLTDNGRDFQGIWFPAALWQDTTLSITQKVILLEVRSFQRNGLPCFISNEHLAELCNVSSSAIEKALKLLVEAGHLRRWTEYTGKKRSRLMAVQCFEQWEHPQPAEATTRNQLRQAPATSYGHHPQPAEATTRNQLRNNNTIEQNTEHTKENKARPQSIEAVESFFASKLVADPASMAEDFWNYYEANGWKVGRNSMKSWAAAASQWIKRQQQYEYNRTTKSKGYTGVSSTDLTRAIQNATRRPNT